jgi:hypothetical protein
MKSDAIQIYVPGTVREPCTLQVVPLEPLALGPGGGAKQVVAGFTGTVLTMRLGPKANAKPMGFVLACPQVPRWMSPEYPAAVEEVQQGAIKLEDYATEWFEKVVYLHKDDLPKAAKAPGGLAWASAMAKIAAAFDNTQSDGCARTVARAPLYRVELGADGLPSGLKAEGVYYSLVWEDAKAAKATVTTPVKEIALAPLASRGAFVETPRHRKQLAESERLAKEVDPERAKAKVRAKHLGAVKKYGKL